MSGVAAQVLDVRLGPRPGTVRLADGEVVTVPDGWALLPPGDATLTRRVKAKGAAWTVKERRGRRLFSQGVWAPARHIAAVREELSRERETPDYQARLAAGRARRARAQVEYAGAFSEAVLEFLAFAPRYDQLARRLARAIADHAVPVGSGTVARTQRIPLDQRAEAATIAWLRHQTTSYDDMKIPRVKGMRREVRRLLAQRSRRVLARYRSGEAIDPLQCPLTRALSTGS
ncbi:MAG: DUF2293 domain-containing protein [Myxococcales bacterium FL481]|nr:MAG: DUF2293 domain-containing protein [Myxococcales bacterium FL481]